MGRSKIRWTESDKTYLESKIVELRDEGFERTASALQKELDEI